MTKYNKCYVIISLIVILFQMACEKIITVAPPPYTSKANIQCMLEPDSVPIVYFNRTVPYFDSKVTFGELVFRGASVKISDGATTDSLSLDSSFDRIICEYNYFYKGNAGIKTGKTYILTISNALDVYTATASTAALSGSIIDSVAYTATYKDLYGEHEGVIVYFKDVPQQANFYRYEMDRFVDTATTKAEAKIASACLGKDSLAVHELGRSVYSDVSQDGGQLKIVIEPAYSHKAGTKGTIYLQTTDSNAYAFFNQLDQQKLAQYNPFIEPVFLQPGQFGDKAIGYFSAMVKSRPFIFHYPE